MHFLHALFDDFLAEVQNYIHLGDDMAELEDMGAGLEKEAAGYSLFGFASIHAPAKMWRISG